MAKPLHMVELKKLHKLLEDYYYEILEDRFDGDADTVNRPIMDAIDTVLDSLKSDISNPDNQP